jgi:hypothetical protein
MARRGYIMANLENRVVILRKTIDSSYYQVEEVPSYTEAQKRVKELNHPKKDKTILQANQVFDFHSTLYVWVIGILLVSGSVISHIMDNLLGLCILGLCGAVGGVILNYLQDRVNRRADKYASNLLRSIEESKANVFRNFERSKADANHNA